MIENSKKSTCAHRTYVRTHAPENHALKNGGANFTTPYLLYMDISLSDFNFSISLYTNYLKRWFYIYYQSIIHGNIRYQKWGKLEDRTCVCAPWIVKFTNPYLLHMDISLSVFSFNVSFYVRYLKIWSYIYFWNINLRNRSCPKWHI